MQLSQGPWSYNRFDKFETSLVEGSKPDFLDKDGDGNKKESFKKAVADSKKDCDCEPKEDCDCDDKKKDSKKPFFKRRLQARNSTLAVLMADTVQNRRSQQHQYCYWQKDVKEAQLLI